MPTTVVNVRLDPCDCYIGRKGVGGSRHMLNTKAGEPGWLGNPWRADSMADPIESFRQAFLRKLDAVPEFRAAVLALRGKRLGCWCKPGACHGDVIAAWLDAQPD